MVKKRTSLKVALRQKCIDTEGKYSVVYFQFDLVQIELPNILRGMVV